MLRRKQSEIFLNEFVLHFEDQVIAADYDQHGRLVVYSNPYLKFETLVIDICENLFDIFHYLEHQEILVYPFGINAPILITIN